MVAPPCCAVCGRLEPSINGQLTIVQFADYNPSWRPVEPDDTGTDPRNKNSIDVYGPEGRGTFCLDHLGPAMRLRQLTLADAVARLKRDRTSAAAQPDTEIDSLWPIAPESPLPYPQGAQYPAPPPQPYAGYYEWPVTLRNGLGVASLVTAILAIFPGSLTCVFGLPLGIIATAMGVAGRRRVKRGEANNAGIAMAGVVLGLVAIVVSAVLMCVAYPAVQDMYDYYQCTSHSHSKGHPECDWAPPSHTR